MCVFRLSQCPVSGSRQHGAVRNPIRISGLIRPWPDFGDLAVVGPGLLSVHVQLVMHWRVADRIEARIRAAVVAMPMPLPSRNDENVVALPVDALAVDLRAAAAFNDAVNRVAGVSMDLAVLAGAKHLRFE